METSEEVTNKSQNDPKPAAAFRVTTDQESTSHKSNETDGMFNNTKEQKEKTGSDNEEFPGYTESDVSSNCQVSGAGSSAVLPNCAEEQNKGENAAKYQEVTLTLKQSLNKESFAKEDETFGENVNENLKKAENGNKETTPEALKKKYLNSSFENLGSCNLHTDEAGSSNVEANGKDTNQATNTESGASNNSQVTPAVSTDRIEEQNMEENAVKEQKANSALKQLSDRESAAKEVKNPERTLGERIHQDSNVAKFVDQENKPSSSDNTATASSENSGCCTFQTGTTQQQSDTSSSNIAEINKSSLASYLPLKDIGAILDHLKCYFRTTPDSGLEKEIHNNKTSSTNSNESERYKQILDKISALYSEFIDLKETVKSYKFKDEQMSSELIKIKNAFKTHYRQLENTKTSSTASSPFWSVISGRIKSEEDDTSNYVQNFFDYIKMLHEDQNNQEAAINSKTEIIHNLQRELNNANTHISNLNYSFDEKRKEQMDILKNQDKAIEKHKKKSCETEVKYQNSITDYNKLVYQHRQSVTKLAETKKSLQDQQYINQKTQKEKSDITHENAVLKSSLDQTRVELAKLTKQLENQENEAVEIKKLFKRDLENIRKTILREEGSLTTEKEIFNKSLHLISNKVKRYTTTIAINDVKRETENKIIHEAIKKIDEIQNGAKIYEDQINIFRGNSEDKKYLDIKEMLIRAVEKLDSIESQKKTKIQTTRRKAINYVKHLQDELESRVVPK